MFEQGEKVFYQGNRYIVLWIYDNNQCELQREDDQYNIELAHTSQLAPEDVISIQN